MGLPLELSKEKKQNMRNVETLYFWSFAECLVMMEGGGVFMADRFYQDWQ